MPFLGKTPSQFVDPEVDIDGGSIDGATIGATSASAGTFTNLTATGTLTFPDDGISGDDISGGTATLDGLTVDTDTLVVDSTNNRVGIGLNNPNELLHVVGAVRIGSGASTAELYTNNNELRLGVDKDDNNAVSNITFYVNNSEKARIDASGNVGIGTANPTSPNGFSRNLTISGSSCSLALDETDFNTWEMITSSGSFRIYDETNERMRLDSSGNLLVGCTAQPSSSVKGMGYGDLAASNGDTSLVLSGGSYTGGDRQISFVNGNGTVGYINTSGSATAYSTTSDYRLKENVVSLDNATDRLKQIPVHRFNFIADPDTTVDGFLAHEVQSVVPEAITGVKDEVDDEGNPVYQGIDQSKLVPLLTKAIQEQQAIIEDLQTRLSALEAN